MGRKQDPWRNPHGHEEDETPQTNGPDGSGVTVGPAVHTAMPVVNPSLHLLH